MRNKYLTFQSFDHPDSIELNSRLFQLIQNQSGKRVVGGGLKSDLNLHKKGIADVNNLLNWIGELIPLVAHNFSIPEPIKFDYRKYLPFRDHGGGKYNFYIDSFKLAHCWSVLYNKGDGVESHNHFPYTISFVYYVNTPEGSSPLMLDDEEIDIVDGRVVLFLSHRYHSVIPNQIDGRCAIVGNILYAP